MKPFNTPCCADCGKILFPIYDGKNHPFVSLKERIITVSYMCSECGDSSCVSRETRAFNDASDMLVCLGGMLRINIDIEVGIMGGKRGKYL